MTFQYYSVLLKSFAKRLCELRFENISKRNSLITFDESKNYMNPDLKTFLALLHIKAHINSFNMIQNLHILLPMPKNGFTI